MRRRLSAPEKEEVLRLRIEDRLSSCEIAKRLHSNTTTICALLKHHPLTAAERKTRRQRNTLIMRHKLVERGEYTNGQDWSDSDSALFRKLWPTASRKRIEGAFQSRSWASLSKRASDQKIRRSRAAGSSGKNRVDKFFRTLREIREARGITREELAERMGIHRIMLAHYELGESRPGWLRIRDWLTALEYDVAAIPANATEKTRGSRQWIAEEEKILRELIAQGSTIPEAALALKRPPHEIEKRATMLGLLESEATRNVSGMTKLRLG